MAKIDDLDNLIAEFEQAAGEISQLKLLVSSAETLKSKLEAMLNDLQNKANDLHTVADVYRNEISVTDGLKTGLKQQIGDAQTFVSNSSKALVGLKNEVKNAISELESNSNQLRQNLSSSVDQAIATLPVEFAKHKQELETEINAALQEFIRRQSALVSNLNQRNDALQSLVETQRTATSSQLAAALLRIEKLEEAIAKRTGILGLFR